MGFMCALMPRQGLWKNRIREANWNIGSAIEQLQETTRLMNANNVEIFQGTDEINNSVNAILRMTVENSDLMNALEEETGRFRIS